MNKRLQYIVLAFWVFMLSGPLMAQEQSVPPKQGDNTENVEDLSAEQQELKLEIKARLSQGLRSQEAMLMF